jgi:hypothetical protein
MLFCCLPHAGTGPGMYDVSNVTSLSPKRNPPSLRFGHAPRDAKVGSVTEQPKHQHELHGMPSSR